VSNTFFISDLHLDPARPAVSAALADFLHRHRDCERLFILGDLFEAWVGDDDDAPLATATAALLRDFSDAGPELAIMVGNRDFLLGEQFCQRAGARLLPDPTVIDLYDTPTLLLHGDSLCTGDAEYQAFRKTARDPQWQAELLSRPLEERRALAAQLRAMSKEANSNKAEDIMDVTPSEVQAMMRDHGVTRMIHGHTHRPHCHEESTGTRWVLGDWDQRGWAIEASAGEIELYNFNIFQ
jgi:UDP-2,3-diacylglucosamine hydrolase